MFNHQYDFNIEIPKAVITKEKHDKIFEELLDNKVLIGLCGYGKSGKDFIAKSFIEDYGFQRVAFADNIKIEMNTYLKESVFEFLKNHNEWDDWQYDEIEGGIELIDGRIITIDDIDFQTEDIPLKKRLRPFIIWYGEKLREINGPCYWVNQAFKIDAAGHDKIILSDVRRIKELDPFKDSVSFQMRGAESHARAGYLTTIPHGLKSYTSLLFEVTQLGLTDGDALTIECIQNARENWMFDDTFYVDPRISEKGKGRRKAMEVQIKRIAKEFKIVKLDKTISPRQTKMFN